MGYSAWQRRDSAKSVSTFQISQPSRVMRKYNVLSISSGGLQQRNDVEMLHENWSKMGTRERKTDRAWASSAKGQCFKENAFKENTLPVVPNLQKTKQKSVQERDLPFRL